MKMPLHAYFAMMGLGFSIPPLLHGEVLALIAFAINGALITPYLMYLMRHIWPKPDSSEAIGRRVSLIFRVIMVLDVMAMASSIFWLLSEFHIFPLIFFVFSAYCLRQSWRGYVAHKKEAEAHRRFLQEMTRIQMELEEMAKDREKKNE